LQLSERTKKSGKDRLFSRSSSNRSGSSPSRKEYQTEHEALKRSKRIEHKVKVEGDEEEKNQIRSNNNNDVLSPDQSLSSELDSDDEKKIKSALNLRRTATGANPTTKVF
jgi:hypothetical protein